MDIKITVKRKLPICGDVAIVCNNSDYTVIWELDEEWSGYDTKTMRTAYKDGTYTDTVFTGNTVALPVVTVPGTVKIGLYAGDIRTSRPALIRALDSITSDGGAPADPPEDVYNQIMELIKKMETVSPEDIAKAVEDYLTEHPSATASMRVEGGYIQFSADGKTWADVIALADLKGAPGKDGAPGDDGITPTIGDNGNWYLGDEDTGKPSRGAPGAKGNPGKDGAGMDVTGATSGQIAKITAVDDNGVPTAWEPVDMPSGEGEAWEKIADVAISADIPIYEVASFATWRKVKIMMNRPAYISGLSKNVWFDVANHGAPASTYFYICGHMTAGYGYRFWTVETEINNMFITSRRITNNNINTNVNYEATADKLLDDVSLENLVMRMRFADTSVVQDGDTVVVMEVRA